MSGGVTLRRGVRVRLYGCGGPASVLGATYRVFVRVHGQRQLLEGPSNLPGRGLPAHPQQLVVIWTLCPNGLHQNDEEQREAKGARPPKPQDRPVPHGRQLHLEHY